jgi:hypothetical protein
MNLTAGCQQTYYPGQSIDTFFRAHSRPIAWAHYMADARQQLAAAEYYHELLDAQMEIQSTRKHIYKIINELRDWIKRFGGTECRRAELVLQISHRDECTAGLREIRKALRRGEYRC